MWIDANIISPPKYGRYKVLVTQDDFGCLQEATDDLFNGIKWDVYHSHSQFVRYWWANEQQYKEISDYFKKGLQEYNEQLEIESKNFGGV